MKNETDLLFITKTFLLAGFSVASTQSNNHREPIKLYYRKKADGQTLSVWPETLREVNPFANSSQFSTSIGHLVPELFSIGLGKVFSRGTAFLYADESVVEDIGKHWGKDYFISLDAKGTMASIHYFPPDKGKTLTTRMALTDEGKALIRKEKDAIAKVNAIGLRRMDCSLTISYTESTLTICDNIFERQHESTPEFLPEHGNALAELYRNRIVVKAIKHLDAFKTASLSLTALTCSEDTRLPQNLISKLAYLKSSIDGEKTVPCAFSHGDFTTVNTEVSQRGVVAREWSKFSAEAPLLTDAFHFVFYSGFVVRKQPAAATLAEIDRLSDCGWVADLVNGHNIDLSLHLRLHLLVSCIAQVGELLSRTTWDRDTLLLLNAWNDLLSIVLSKTKLLNQRQLLTMDLFCYLRDKAYAALKWDAEFPEELSMLSDLELCIGHADLEGIEHFLSMHPFSARIERQPLSWMSNYSIETGDGLQLGVDLIWKFSRKGLVFADAPMLLASAHLSKGGVKVPDVTMDFAYTWLYFILDSQSVPEDLQEKFMRLDARDRDRLNGYFTKEWRATGMLHYAFAMDHLSDLTRTTRFALKRKKINQGPSAFLNRIMAAYDGFVGVLFKEQTPMNFSYKAKAAKYIPAGQMKIQGVSHSQEGYIKRSA